MLNWPDPEVYKPCEAGLRLNIYVQDVRNLLNLNLRSWYDSATSNGTSAGVDQRGERVLVSPEKIARGC